MTFDEKKHLLHWLFEGKGEYDYFLYGKITGLRITKGANTDYTACEEGGEEYKINSVYKYKIL